MACIAAACSSTDRPVTPAPTDNPAKETASESVSSLPPPIIDYSPSGRHTREKRLMLDLINAERVKADVPTLVLGDNPAPQVHAEEALENCFTSHWGLDGLKPYMRYSLAGGYQINGENMHGNGFCLPEEKALRSFPDIESALHNAVQRLMTSPGHQENMLDPLHRKVTIGLAWNPDDLRVVHLFEGDYVEYEVLPVIRNGTLLISGKVKNGAAVEDGKNLEVHIQFDPPPRDLTVGQVVRTYCYPVGARIAMLRPPARGDMVYFMDSMKTVLAGRTCPDPHEVEPAAAPPASIQQARNLWRMARDASSIDKVEQEVVLTLVTADRWEVSASGFSVRADLSGLLSEYGNGVYTVVVSAPVMGEQSRISMYSLFVNGLPEGPGHVEASGELPSEPAHRRHLDVKQRMLEIINERRADSDLPTMTLSDNGAAQMHAEASLQGCYRSHWDLNGSSDSMRYSLAGGYHANHVDLFSNEYCVQPDEGLRTGGAMDGWLTDNVLAPRWRKVSIGLAWDEYNRALVIRYESDHVEFDHLPSIDGGVLKVSGTVKNGLHFADPLALVVEVHHQDPPRPLTRGQVSRAYCRDPMTPAAIVIIPPRSDRQVAHPVAQLPHRLCPSPHDISPDTVVPTSPEEAALLKAKRLDDIRDLSSVDMVVPTVNASEWNVAGSRLSVAADLRSIVAAHGAGFYRVLLWARQDDSFVLFADYAIFLGSESVPGSG